MMEGGPSTGTWERATGTGVQQSVSGGSVVLPTPPVHRRASVVLDQGCKASRVETAWPGKTKVSLGHCSSTRWHGLMGTVAIQSRVWFAKPRHCDHSSSHTISSCTSPPAGRHFWDLAKGKLSCRNISWGSEEYIYVIPSHFPA